MTLAAAPSVLVIALAANELSTPRTTAILNTAHDVLGNDVTLRLEVYSPNGHEGDADSQLTPSQGYAWISWDSGDPNLAHLHCFVPQTGHWVRRDVAFTPQDPPLEAGRTLGFVIASIYVANESITRAPSASVPHQTRKEDQAAHIAARRFIVQGAISLAGPGDATSTGVWVGAQWRATDSLSVGIATTARFGTVAAAQASTRFTNLGGLATYRLWPARGDLWLGTQLYFGVEQLSFSHFSDDDARPVAGTNWLLVSEASALLNWEVTESMMLFMATGVSYRFGDTDVIVRGVQRAHIPAWLGVGRVGFGTRF